MLAVVCGTEKSLPSIPRSKGCLNCISRRKRCDGRRPSCNTCKNRMEVCRGYRRSEFAFLNEGWRTLGVAKAKNIKQQSVQTIPGTCAVVELEAVSSSCALHGGLNIDLSLVYTSFFLSDFATRLLPSPHFISGIFSSYFSSLPSHLSTNTRGDLSAPVVLAVDALAQGHFGKAKFDVISIRESFQKYGMALRSMSFNIEALKLADRGLTKLPEDEWQHLTFFCIVMAFWELRMAPACQNWKTHIRALSDAICVRGTDHKYSKSNIVLIMTCRLLITLQLLSSRQPGRLLFDEWQERFSIPENWIDPIKCSDCGNMDPIPLRACRNHTSVDILESLMGHITSMVSIMAGYDQLAIEFSKTGPTQRFSVDMKLIELYNASEQALKQAEISLAWWKTPLGRDVPREEYLVHFWSDQPTNFWWQNQLWPTLSHAIGLLFDRFLSFESMKAYQVISLFWTTVMSLHLLVLDILDWMVRANSPCLPENSHEGILFHRNQLVGYAEKVIRAIPYAGRPENGSNTPFFLATAHQITILVLEREGRILKAEDLDSGLIKKVESMKELAARYLNWLEQSKIAVTVDIDCLYRGFFLDK